MAKAEPSGPRPRLTLLACSASLRAEQRGKKIRTLVSGGGMNVLAGVGGGAEATEAAPSGGGTVLLELTPHKIAVCQLVHVLAPPSQAWGGAGLPFPFESVAHHNRLGLFLFTLTRVRARPRLLAPPRSAAARVLVSAVALVYWNVHPAVILCGFRELVCKTARKNSDFLSACSL
jgi:hypothetical protein